MCLCVPSCFSRILQCMPTSIGSSRTATSPHSELCDVDVPIHCSSHARVFARAALRRSSDHLEGKGGCIVTISQASNPRGGEGELDRQGLRRSGGAIRGRAKRARGRAASFPAHQDIGHGQSRRTAMLFPPLRALLTLVPCIASHGGWGRGRATATALALYRPACTTWHICIYACTVRAQIY